MSCNASSTSRLHCFRRLLKLFKLKALNCHSPAGVGVLTLNLQSDCHVAEKMLGVRYPQENSFCRDCSLSNPNLDNFYHTEFERGFLHLPTHQLSILCYEWYWPFEMGLDHVRYGHTLACLSQDRLQLSSCQKSWERYADCKVIVRSD